MVGACQQNSGIFLVRGGGLERDVGEGRGLGRDKMPVTKSPGRQRTRSGQRPDKMPARKSPGRQRARSGQGPDEMPARAEAGGKINSKESAL